MAITDPFVGMPYCERTFDCADFVVHVMRELFGRDVDLPNGRPRGRDGQVALGDLSREYAKPITTPSDGDLVLMRTGRGWHVGLFFSVAHEPCVLHCPADPGHSILQRIREMPQTITGYYTWI